MLNSVSLPVINGLRLLYCDCYDKENVRTVGLTKAIDIIRPRYYYSSDTVSIMFSENAHKCGSPVQKHTFLLLALSHYCYCVKEYADIVHR